MAKYTIELRDLISSVDIFDFERVSLYTPEGMEETERFNALKNRFYAKYLWREICYEVSERWIAEFQAEWNILSQKYNTFWQLYDRTFNLFTNNSSNSQLKTLVYNTPDTPLTPEQISDFITSVNETNSNISQMVGTTELEMINTFIERLKDLDDNFINHFSSLFMKIY